MGFARTVLEKCRHLGRYAVALAAILIAGSACRAQSKPAGQQPEMPWTQDFTKYPGLLDELGRLVEKLQQNVQFPPPRVESRLLPLLPPATFSYASSSNYGDATHQALAVFRQELQESAVLRDWWGHDKLAEGGPKLEDLLEKFYQLEQFLGDEIVLSGSMDGQEPRLLVAAEIHKPGLKKFLQDLIKQPAGNSPPDVRVLDAQELAAAKDDAASKHLIVLVRADYVVAAFDMATLRGFNTRLESRNTEFAATPFGQRILKEYEGGVSVLAAADLQKFLNQVPSIAKGNPKFQQSGFADVKYLVWDRKTVAGQTVSQTELSFNALRHGAASWLAKSAPLTNMDFVSPKAIFAGTLALASLPQMFDDLKEMEGASGASSFATVTTFEQALKLSLKDDLLSYLTGEITVEMDSMAPPAPVWKVILRVTDADRLQKTLSTLLTAGNLQAERSEEGGVTYYTLRVPSGKTTTEISYAFVDGHLIIGSGHGVVADAVRLHAAGESLGKDPRFLAALPAGHSLSASALFYQDPTATTALSMQQVAPEIAAFLRQFTKKSPPSVVCLYGDANSIRAASQGGAFDVGAVLVGAAVAIPNLLRSRGAANEASAVASIRTINVAQVTYAATYPDRGFAPALAKFGTGPGGPAAVSADHAGLIDESLSNASCGGDAWCTKAGYQFRIKAVCMQHQCADYVVVATPVDSNTGTRSFCSTSSGVIRSKSGPLSGPVSVAECKTWSPLK